MHNYSVKKPADLSEEEIQLILQTWDVDEWKEMAEHAFREKFKHSEFHLLTGSSSNLLSVARINFKFKVSVGEKEYEIAELVGFVTVEILKGYGKVLLGKIAENLKGRNVEAIGFCKKRTSPYYESVGLKVFHEKVKHLREKKNDQWFTPTEDDDIVALTLEDHTIEIFQSLSDERPAYLFFE